MNGISEIGSRRRPAGWSLAIGLLAAGVASGCSDPSGTAPDSLRPLTAAVVPGGVFCDGTNRPAAELTGAWPGEVLRFESPAPVEIADGTADDQGGHRLMWSCEPNESGLTWELTAAGAESGRTVAFTISGSDVDPELATILIFDAAEQGPVCDGARHVIGRISNATAHEVVEFSTDHTRRVSPGTADSRGSLDVYWKCSVSEVDLTRTVRARGSSSGRTVQFTVVGLAPVPADKGGIEIQMVENPFACDRGRRPVATLTNLTPGITVDFEMVAEPSNLTGEGPAELASGSADSDGTLDVYWTCRRDQATTEWTVTATERSLRDPASDGGGSAETRSAILSFRGAEPPNPLSIEVIEDPFICDGERRDVASLTGFVPNEFVDFTSPQVEVLREGQADGNGRLTAGWQCEADDVGRRWEVTATGRTSKAARSFTITGAAP